jgi:hypothetical protein
MAQDIVKSALVVGVDDYAQMGLAGAGGCGRDAREIAQRLLSNADETGNFDEVRLLASRGPAETRPTLDRLTEQLDDLLVGRGQDEDVLFYFAGHAVLKPRGLMLAAEDGSAQNPGYSANDVVDLANKSKARSVTVILDCCHSGAAGNAADWFDSDRITLRENVTVLAAARPEQKAGEIERAGAIRGKFTDLLIEGLDGAAGDQRGQVTALSLYAYAVGAFGPKDDQTPVIKSYATRLPVLRTARPWLSNDDLGQLTYYFETEISEHPVTQAYEVEPYERDGTTYRDRSRYEGEWTPEMAAFDYFKALQACHLLELSADDQGRRDSIYFTATRTRGETGAVWLAPLGRYYWRIVHSRSDKGIKRRAYWRPGEPQPVHGGPGGHDDAGRYLAP